VTFRPNLDDRTFQDLVDEAKRMVQRRWPEWTGWTDHNVSDPGVTLIETFAYMVDQLIFRLNRAPDKNYVKFLEMIGIELRPPHAAAADVTFWLGAAATSRRAAAGIEVATERTDVSDAIVFRTSEPLDIVPCHRAAARRPRPEPRGPDRLPGHRSGDLPCSPVAGTGRRVLRRVVEPDAVLRGGHSVRRRRGGLRHRSARPAARVGGVDAAGMEVVRDRAG
jgi:hypothetical protein